MSQTYEVLLFTTEHKFRRRLTSELDFDANVRAVKTLDQALRFLTIHSNIDCVVIDPDPAVKMDDLRSFIARVRHLGFTGVLSAASNDPSKTQTLLSAGCTMSARKDLVAAKIIEEAMSR